MRQQRRLALAAAGLAATAAVQPTAAAETYRVPSAAMAPTLVPGDVVRVEPYFAGSTPQAGDVVALRGKRNPTSIYLDRVTGLPGDRVQMVAGRLVINGLAIAHEAEAPYPNPTPNGLPLVERWRETLPNGATYSTLDSEDGGPLDDTPPFDVPVGHYFVMGDNRDNSADSRVPEIGLGFVPRASIFGHARRL